MSNYYFDNAATSFPKAPGLSQYISNYIDTSCVNINRGVYSQSENNQNMVLDTRKKIASFFDCSDNVESFSKRVIFTSGITMSINMFLRGILKSKDHIIVGAMEHHAVMRTLYDLKEKHDVEFSIAKVDEYGIVDVNETEKLIKNNTKVIMVSHASNVFGTINDIEKIGQLSEKYNLIFAVDSAQTAGTVDISFRRAKIDFLAFAGHKGLLGLQGIGGFIISQRLSRQLPSLITGGTGSISHSYKQPEVLPDKYESGTLNLPGIASINYSLDYLNDIGINNIRKHELSLRKQFIDGISKVDGVDVYCKNIDINKVTSVVSISFRNKDNAEIAFLLSEKYGIQTRQGIHCSLIAHETMNTVENGTIRFSFGYFNSEEDVQYAVNSIKEICG